MQDQNESNNVVENQSFSENYAAEGPTSVPIATATQSDEVGDQHTDGANNPNSPSSNVSDQRPPVSPKKIEANRRNAQKSCGPKTEEGKTKSAANSFKHGFFAKRLFAIGATAKQDQVDYFALASELHAHFDPQGPVEKLALDTLTVDILRRARLMEYEEKELVQYPHLYVCEAVDRLQRRMNALNRQISAEFKEIERLQSTRTARDAEANRRAHDNGEEESNELSADETKGESESL